MSTTTILASTNTPVTQNENNIYVFITPANQPSASSCLPKPVPAETVKPVSTPTNQTSLSMVVEEPKCLSDQLVLLDQHPSPITPQIRQAIAVLEAEGHSPHNVRKALLADFGRFGKGAAQWTVHRNKSWPAETLIESIRLSVVFADACDAAGNRRPNPYTHKEINPFRMLLTVDDKDPTEIRELIAWTFQDDFWSSNILSAAKFRKQWDRLAGGQRRDRKKRQQPSDDWMIRRLAR